MRVHPRASRRGVSAGEDGILQVRVTAPPVEGEANAAVIELLAEWLGLRRSRLSLDGGQKSRLKRIDVHDITQPELDALVLRRIAAGAAGRESPSAQ